MFLTSNRGFAEWGKVFGDPVVAKALLDRLLHHAVVVQIEGASLSYVFLRLPCDKEVAARTLNMPVIGGGWIVISLVFEDRSVV